MMSGSCRVCCLKFAERNQLRMPSISCLLYALVCWWDWCTRHVHKHAERELCLGWAHASIKHSISAFVLGELIASKELFADEAHYLRHLQGVSHANTAELLCIRGTYRCRKEHAACKARAARHQNHPRAPADMARQRNLRSFLQRYEAMELYLPDVCLCHEGQGSRGRPQGEPRHHELHRREIVVCGRVCV